MIHRIVYALAIGLFALPCLLPSQEAAEGDTVAKWKAALAQGRDIQVMEEITAALEKDAQAAPVLRLGVAVARNVGRQAQALKWSQALAAREGATPDDAYLRAEVLAACGRDAEAMEALAPGLVAKKPAPKDATAFHFPSAALAGEISRRRGKDRDADRWFDALVQEAKRIIIKRPADLGALSRAYAFYGGRQGIKLAEEVLVEAQEKEPAEWRWRAQLGQHYFRVMYLYKEAVREFEAALKMRDGLADVHFDLAETLEAWRKSEKAGGHRRLAGVINSEHPGVLKHQAVEHLGNMRLKRADEVIDRLMKVNPVDRETLTLQATSALLRADNEAFEGGLEKVLDVDPTYGRAFLLVSDVLNERRRWPECLDLCRRGVKIDPEDPLLADAHARYAYFLGLEKEGLAALRKANAADSVGHPWRINTFRLAKKIGRRFRTLKTENFVHRVNELEFAILKEYVTDFAEKSLDLLQPKYGYDPRGIQTDAGRVLVEWFDDHQDFSVRTLGFKHLGASGVCFGPFIACLSPSAMPPGQFTWARTFHHELAHTMTVGLSKGRTPRWLTEGMSTYEELVYEKGWSRYLDRQLFDAYAWNELLPVLDFDAAFRTPRVIYAYYQGGLVCEWMVERFGFDKIIAMLEAYAEDKSSGEILKTVLGVSPAEFDEGFRGFVKKRLKDVKLLAVPSGEKAKEFEAKAASGQISNDERIGLAAFLAATKKPAEAVAILSELSGEGAADPRVSFLRGRIAMLQKDTGAAAEAYASAIAKGYENSDMFLDLGDIARAAGQSEKAREYYERSRDTFSNRVDKDDPRLRLAAMATAAGDAAEALRHYEAHLAKNTENLEIRRKAVRLAGRLGKHDARLNHLRWLVLIYPMDLRPHVQLGNLLLEKGGGKDALREFRVAVALADGGIDEADARVGLARSLLEVENDSGGAFLEVRKALALVPEHKAAQRLMEEIRGRRR